MKFLDEAKIYVESGHGGAGCIAFRREKFIEYGGPDGGNGGRGGDVIIRAVANLNTLIDYRYKQHFRAGGGRQGSGQNRTGADGDTVLLTVPVGTQVLDDDKETVLLDFTEDGQEVVFLRGGRGGMGNAFFKNSVNRSPRFAQPGEPGEERWIWLRLKLIADVGLVGMPNAGKSTLLAATSRAKPKIADYPFTTLQPGLGVVAVDDGSFVMADIPGLIEGASEGHGLGDKFLAHIERCRLLLHLVDGTGEDVAHTYNVIREELTLYAHGLADKPEVVALNKVDALDVDTLAERRAALEQACGKQVWLLSGVSGEGLQDLLRHLRQRLAQHEEEE